MDVLSQACFFMGEDGGHLVQLRHVQEYNFSRWCYVACIIAILVYIYVHICWRLYVSLRVCMCLHSQHDAVRGGELRVSLS